MSALSSSAQKVQDTLVALGSTAGVVEHDKPARTAAEAAQLLRCDIAQIAKSIIFKNAITGRSVLVIASGASRVDEQKVASIVGDKLVKADAVFVREQTGFAIGGVPPVAHANPGAILLDVDLLKFDQVFPAGGTPHAMFAIDPSELLRISGAQAAEVRQGSSP